MRAIIVIVVLLIAGSAYCRDNRVVYPDRYSGLIGVPAWAERDRVADAIEYKAYSERGGLSQEGYERLTAEYERYNEKMDACFRQDAHDSAYAAVHGQKVLAERKLRRLDNHTDACFDN